MCDLWFFYSANKPLFTFLTLPNKPLLVFCWLLCWFHCWFSQPQKTVEKREKGSEMIYTSRGMRRRGDSDKWEVVLSHHDPLSGEQVPTYHTVEAMKAFFSSSLALISLYSSCTVFIRSASIHQQHQIHGQPCPFAATNSQAIIEYDSIFRERACKLWDGARWRECTAVLRKTLSWGFRCLN